MKNILVLLLTIVIPFVSVLYPNLFIIISVLGIIGYIIYTTLNSTNRANKDKTTRRQNALNIAKMYLSPYKDIWHNLKLSNKYCSISLGADGVTIFGKENINNHRTFRVIKSNIHDINDFWNILCINFYHLTTYDELLTICETFDVTVHKSSSKAPSINTGKNITNKNGDLVPKIDINNASEIEITALPGISIVLAKKLIKKREEIGGFKSIDDIFLFLKLKPHMESQLRNLICVNKIKGSIVTKKYQERQIDL